MLLLYCDSSKLGKNVTGIPETCYGTRVPRLSCQVCTSLYNSLIIISSLQLEVCAETKSAAVVGFQNLLAAAALMVHPKFNGRQQLLWRTFSY